MFFIVVLVGAKLSLMLACRGGDQTLHALSGMKRFSTGRYDHLFRQFGMCQVHRIFEPLAEC